VFSLAAQQRDGGGASGRVATWLMRSTWRGPFLVTRMALLLYGRLTFFIINVFLFHWYRNSVGLHGSYAARLISTHPL